MTVALHARPLIAALCAALGLAAAYPVLAAPVLPDWSGVWNPRERNLFDPSSLKPADRKAKDTGSSLFEASYLRMYPPYRADYEARYDKTLKNTVAGVGSDPTAACLPPGFPRIMGTPYPLEFMVQPDRVTILFEAFGQTRRIYTDGRKHPDDLDPSYNGHSIGHWEGDTLVVDTVGIKPNVRYKDAPHSDQMRIAERIKKIAPDMFQDQITVTDPVYLTGPWSWTYIYKRKPGYKINEYVCEDNREFPDPDKGTQRLRLLGQ
jgi:hypothetical protein